MPLTDSSEIIANYIYLKLRDPTNMSNLGVASVWYGDQDILPTTPALCVSPGTKERQFSGATFRTENMLETYVLVYCAKITDIQQNLHQAIALADAIETLVHSDLKLGGNTIATLCRRSEPGVINKQGVWVMGARLTFESLTKTTLPQQVV
jgi:hypothetical protein